MRYTACILSLVFMASCSPASVRGEAPSGAPAGKPADPRVAAVERAAAVLPAEARAGFLEAFSVDSAGFFALLEKAERESAAAGDLLVLVDKKHALDPAFEPGDLVSLNGYPLARNRQDLRLRASIMPAVLEMDAAARAAGARLVYSSSYRSYAYQESVYARHVSQMGREGADRVSARPGHSQHQLGTAIDFGSIDDSFADTAAGKWLAGNAWRFGFSLSYPKGYEAVTGYDWESWHYRYITQAGALLERGYFGGIQQYFLLFLDEYRRLLK